MIKLLIITILLFVDQTLGVIFLLLLPFLSNIWLKYRSKKFLNFLASYWFYEEQEAEYDLRIDGNHSSLNSYWGKNLHENYAKIIKQTDKFIPINNVKFLRCRTFFEKIKNCITNEQFAKILEKLDEERLTFNDTKLDNIDKMVNDYKIQKRIIYVDSLINETELLDDFFCFRPSKFEIINITKYLKKNGLITKTDKFWFTTKGLATINNPMNFDDDLKNLLSYIFK